MLAWVSTYRVIQSLQTEETQAPYASLEGMVLCGSLWYKRVGGFMSFSNNFLVSPARVDTKINVKVVIWHSSTP